MPAVDVPLMLPVADGDDEDGDDEADDVLEPLFAFVSTNDSALDELEGVALVEPVADVDEPVPDVPTAPPIRLACCRQPVIVIVLALELDWFDAVELPLVDCPAAPVPNASASAATPPIHTLRFMPPPSSWVDTRRFQLPFHTEMGGKPRRCGEGGTKRRVERYRTRRHSERGR